MYREMKSGEARKTAGGLMIGSGAYILRKA
jgi:hypothetical protein